MRHAAWVVLGALVPVLVMAKDTRQDASSASAAPAATAAAAEAAAYKPLTAHDNTPYRFNMEQNGRRMTAEEFDAWMKARGIRVAKGAPAPAAGAPAQAAAAPAR